MKSILSQGLFPPIVSSYFEEGQLSPFIHERVLWGLFAKNWFSVFIYESESAFLHCFTINPIGCTHYYDIEPWLGYAGPVIKKPNQNFVDNALKEYTRICKEMRIIAEIIRFDPLRSTHFFSDQNIEFLESRPIAYVPLLRDEAQQLSIYAPPCRRRVKAGENNLLFKEIKKEGSSLDQFILLYHQSLKNVNASERWYFDRDFFRRWYDVKQASIWGVFDKEEGILACAMLAIAAPPIVYSLLIATGDVKKYVGASEFLTHGVACQFVKLGYQWLCLGGGRSNSLDDSLFKYKAKFGGINHVKNLPIGFITHNAEMLAQLNNIAKEQGFASMPIIQPSNELIRKFMPYRLVPDFINSKAVSLLSS